MLKALLDHALNSIRLRLRAAERVGTRLARLPGEPLRDLGRIHLGRHSYSFGTAIVYDTNSTHTITVGNFCSIAEGVEFMLDGGHRHDFITSSPLHTLGQLGPPGHNSGASITIEHDVWIGRDALILPGVTIGTGAVIGSRAVVAKDVPPYAIVVGNPGRAVRRRFTDAECEVLLASRWWEWPDDKVLAARDDLWSGDVSRFAERWLEPAPAARHAR